MKICLKKIFNIYILQVIELLLAVAIIILSFYNIKPILSPDGVKTYSKIVLPDNVKFLNIIFLALILAFYLLEWINKPGLLRIPYFIIMLIVCLVMLLENDKNLALENINIAIAIGAMFYVVILSTLIIYEICKKNSRKN